jgi:hypothetical protein
MALVSATEYATKWQQRTGAAATDYVAGAERTDKDPTQLAIAAIPRMRQNVLAAIDSGKVASGLRRSGKQGWLAGVSGKGAQNFASSVSAPSTLSKVEAAAAPLLSYISAGLSRLNSMPNITNADRDARQLFWSNYMRGYVKPGG